MIKKDWLLHVFGSPFSLVCLPTHFRDCFELLMQSGSGLLGELAVKIQVKCVPALPGVVALVKSGTVWSVCAVLLATVLYPPWWDRAEGWRTWWWEVSVGFIRNQNPSGITHSSAASFVFVVTYSQTQFNVLAVQWKRFNENGLPNALQESA